MKIKNILVEASYPGNIGAMEVFNFYKLASDEQKEQFDLLVSKGNNESAWEIIQNVTGVILHR
jgi:hypothetical protein